MTQDEVELIYDCLHENYEYCDGDLIRIKNRANRKIGEKLGSVNSGQRSGRLKIQCNIFVKGKTYSMQLQHLIYIYHNKVKVKYLRHKDQNPMNTKIENLEECTLSGTHHLNNYNTPKKGYQKITIYGQTRYRPAYQPRGKKVLFDSYETKEQAIEAYIYAKQIYYDSNFSSQEIYQKVHDKFPGLAPKRRPHHTLPKGVYVSGNHFIAQIHRNKKNIKLGLFANPEEASKCYLNAKELLDIKKMDPEQIKEMYKFNKPKRKHLPGVCAKKKKFRATISKNKQIIRLGLFDTEQEAHEAYLKAKEEYNK